MGTELGGDCLSRGTNKLGTHCGGPNVRGPYAFGIHSTKCGTAKLLILKWSKKCVPVSAQMWQQRQQGCLMTPMSILPFGFLCHLPGLPQVGQIQQHILAAKLYIPGTLNIDLILWHTQLILCAENVKSWLKSWVIHFTFQTYTQPNTLNCMYMC